jgi:hypothetical protein
VRFFMEYSNRLVDRWDACTQIGCCSADNCCVIMTKKVNYIRSFLAAMLRGDTPHLNDLVSGESCKYCEDSATDAWYLFARAFLERENKYGFLFSANNSSMSPMECD